MLHFQTWKIVIIAVVCAFGVIFSAPNLFSPETLAKLPGFLPKQQVNLGLDLRGGSHLLLEVDFGAALKERLNNVVDSARTALRNARVGYTGLNVEGDKVVLALRDFDQIKGQGRVDEDEELFRDLDPDLVPTIGNDGQVTLRYSDIALTARRKAAVDQSIEIVRRRVDETGTKEPTIQRQGDDRILVQLPGIENPEHVKQLLGRTAKMTFQLVDTSVSPEEAQRGRLPPGDELLLAESDGRRPGQAASYVVRKRVIVSGDMLVDAQPTFQHT